jgi:purine-nucleoside/S-methyl-5'-thioadenosine phosphorylase / adenosine deaminase
MKKCRKGGLPCYQFHLIEGFSEDIEHGVFTKAGGVSQAPFNSLNVKFGIRDPKKNVIENRRRVFYALGAKYSVSSNQAHGRRVLLIDAKKRKTLFPAGGPQSVEVENYDGFVTDQRGIGLMIQVADCQAILFFDPGKKILGIAHAGWKGLKLDISGKVIEKMVKLGSNPEHILVGISPSLGPASSEFTNPEKELGPEFMPFVKNNHVDMWEFSRKQLRSHGIARGRIEVARIDTGDTAEGARFFSYRREDRKTGRFAVLAMIK